MKKIRIVLLRKTGGKKEFRIIPERIRGGIQKYLRKLDELPAGATIITSTTIELPQTKKNDELTLETAGSQDLNFQAFCRALYNMGVKEGRKGFRGLTLEEAMERE